MEQLEFHNLLNQLRRHEGFRLRHYQDRAGKFSAGVGRNLEEVAAIRAGAVTLLERDVRRIVQQLEEGLRAFGTLNIVRQRVLIHMAFNISVSGLLLMNRFVAAVELGYWTVAAEEMLHSAWAAEGRERAVELAEMMRTGHDQPSLVSERRSSAG